MSDRVERGTKIVLTGVFLGLFGLFVFVNVRTGWLRFFLPGWFDIALLALATFRLGRLIAYDRVFEPFRAPFTRTVPDETGAGESVEPRGKGVRQAIGQLISCPICAGTWVAAILVYLLLLYPDVTRLFLTFTAVIGAAELLNGVNEALCWRAERDRALAGRERALAGRSATEKQSGQPQ